MHIHSPIPRRWWWRGLCALLLLSGGIILWHYLSWPQQLARAEQHWHALAIHSYRLQVTSRSRWHAVQTDARVVADQVISYHCDALLNATDCTYFQGTSALNSVSQLFARLHVNATDPIDPAQCMHAIFDPRYSIPTYIAIDCPNMIDEENTLSVDLFEPDTASVQP